MKDLKNISGAVAAIISVVVVRYIIQKIGMENIPIKIQISILLLSPLLFGVGIYKFSATKNISKHLIAAAIIFMIAAIVVGLLMFIKERYPYNFDVVKIPLVLLLFVLLLTMLVVLIIGLGQNQKR